MKIQYIYYTVYDYISDSWLHYSLELTISLKIRILNNFNTIVYLNNYV